MKSFNHREAGFILESKELKVFSGHLYKFGIAGKGFASKELAQEKLDVIIAYQAENGEVLMTKSRIG